MSIRRRGRVVLFTGPTGAGKSTCAQAWASSRDDPTAWFDHDEARFLLRSGYVSRRQIAADESLRPQADRQWLLAAAVCESMAEAYVSEGVDFALSAFRPFGEWMGCWSRLDLMSPLIVVLAPPIEVALARDTTRTGRAHTGPESIRRAYSHNWQDWAGRPNAHIIDNASMSVQEVVEVVESLVPDRPGPVAD